MIREDDKRHNNRWHESARTSSAKRRKLVMFYRMRKFLAVMIENEHVMSAKGTKRVKAIKSLLEEKGISMTERSVYIYMKRLGMTKHTKSVTKTQFTMLEKFKREHIDEPRDTNKAKGI